MTTPELLIEAKLVSGILPGSSISNLFFDSVSPAFHTMRSYDHAVTLKVATSWNLPQMAHGWTCTTIHAT